MRVGAFLVVLSLGSSPALAEPGKRGMVTQWFAGVATESVNFATTTGADASYKTSSVGGGAMIKFSTDRQYGLGLKGAFYSRKGNNTANGEVNTSGVREEESLKASIFDVGVRFYALDVFIGMGVTYMPVTIGYTTSSQTVPTETKYSSFGASIELGIDLFLGESAPLFITPKIEFRTGSASTSEGTARSHRISGFGAGLGMGLAF